jgi:hypothetical protein
MGTVNGVINTTHYHDIRPMSEKVFLGNVKGKPDDMVSESRRKWGSAC